MPLVDRVSARREAVRADPITLEEFGYLLERQGIAQSRSGVSVSEDRALGITGWYRGVRYLAEAVTQMPVHVFRDRRNERVERTIPPWMRAPSQDVTWRRLVEHWVVSMINRGNGFAFKERNMQGQVVGLVPLTMKVRYGVVDGRKVFRLQGLDDVAFTTREILHVPGISLDAYFGIDPIRYLANALGTAAAGDDFAAGWFAGSDKIKQYVSIPDHLTQEQARETADLLKVFHAGLQNAHELGVLSNGAELKAVQLDPAQMQLLESRRFSVTEMARILGCPPHKLYDLERATFSNIEHQAIEAVQDSELPWAQRIEDAVNNDRDLLPAGNKIEFKAEGRLRGDSKSRAEFYTAMGNVGAMSPKTMAELEDLPAPDELDYYMRPLNMAVIRPGIGEEVPDDDPTGPGPTGGDDQ